MSWELRRACVVPPPAGKNTLAERGLPPVDHLTPPEELRERFPHLHITTFYGKNMILFSMFRIPDVYPGS